MDNYTKLHEEWAKSADGKRLFAQRAFETLMRGVPLDRSHYYEPDGTFKEVCYSDGLVTWDYSGLQIQVPIMFAKTQKWSDQLVRLNVMFDDGDNRPEGDPGHLVVEHLHVHPDFQGIGLASLVAENSFNLARELGYKGVRCIAGDYDGIKFWPRFMRFHDRSVDYGGDMFGRGGNLAYSRKGFERFIQNSLKYMREDIAKGTLPESINEKILFFNLDDPSSPHWLDHVLDFDAWLRKERAGELNSSILTKGSWAKGDSISGNMISDFDNADDAARAGEFFKNAGYRRANFRFTHALDNHIEKKKAASPDLSQA